MARTRFENLAPIRTLGQLARCAPGWVRLYCETPDCGHHTAVRLAPLVQRWGPDAPRDWMLTRFRCAKCGRRNTSIRMPSTRGHLGFEPFPNSIALQT